MPRAARWLRSVSLPKTPSISFASIDESEHHRQMIAIGLLFVRMLCDRFRSLQQLEVEILVLRHQLNILQRRPRSPTTYTWVDRALFIWLYRRCPRTLDAMIVRTRDRGAVASHGLCRLLAVGVPFAWGPAAVTQEVRDLIRTDEPREPAVGCHQIHGELLKLGIEVAQPTVSTYMVPQARSAAADLEDLPPQSRRRGLRRSICLWCRRLSFRSSSLFSF